ncbi:MAG: phage portal protein, partial [Ruminococcus sp.]|nr:phage portal protein [Ruminococcus sp.]
LNPAPQQSFNINEYTTRETEIIRSQLWYRGDANELFQFFHQLNGVQGSFWGSVPSDSSVRKVHSGIPAIIADTLAYIVKSDMDGIEAPDEWDDIAKNIDFVGTVGKAIIDTLVEGDGAFRVSADGDKIELGFVGASRCEYEDNEVIIHTEYSAKKRTYMLSERYGKGFIESRLYDENGHEVPLSTVPDLMKVQPYIVFNGGYCLAVPLRFYASKKYKGRGKSIFDGGKSDCFDALDEVISQWWDAVRQGRVKQYIPESMMPRDPNNGSLLAPNQFGNNYISVSAPLIEGVNNQEIKTVQPEIKYEAFVSAYMNALLMCLQGLVSPATLGIDVGKMSSADAQREKKDVTGHTRNTITAALENVLPKVINAVFMTLDNIHNTEPIEREVTVSFGEYGAPDFDSRVETVGKAATYGIMSTETQVDELWGGSKDDEFKAAEVQRIKTEKGIMAVSEPSVGGEP